MHCDVECQSSVGAGSRSVSSEMVLLFVLTVLTLVQIQTLPSTRSPIASHLPSLTKEAFVFRVIQATIDQRAPPNSRLSSKPFSKMMSLPWSTTSSESTSSFDFFGYWRRDYKLATYQLKPRTSITSSIFSAYFSSSNQNPKYPGSVTSSRLSPSCRTIRETTGPRLAIAYSRQPLGPTPWLSSRSFYGL
jgi:hypothetical protein